MGVVVEEVMPMFGDEAEQGQQQDNDEEEEQVVKNRRIKLKMKIKSLVEHKRKLEKIRELTEQLDIVLTPKEYKLFKEKLKNPNHDLVRKIKARTNLEGSTKNNPLKGLL